MTWSELAGAANEAVRDTFGASCSYTPAARPVETIVAVVREAGTLVQLGNQVAVQTTTPTAWVVAADLTVEPAQGDTIDTGTQAYEVTSVERNTNGMWKLGLSAI